MLSDDEIEDFPPVGMGFFFSRHDDQLEIPNLYLIFI